MQLRSCLARPRARAGFDIVFWAAGPVVVLLVVLFAGRKMAELTGRPLPPRFDRAAALSIWWIYWGSVIVFGLVTIARWRNSYFRWRTLGLMVSQTLFGLFLGGPLRSELNVPYFWQRLHLTWPLHTSVITPYLKDYYANAFIYGLVASLVAWPLITYFIGLRYCSWFCFCGNLAETTGDLFRLRGPKGPGCQSLDNIGYAVLGSAMLVTVLLWLGVTAPFAWYDLLIGFFVADVIGIAAYPLLGSRVWCRFFCPLRAMLGWFSRRGKFAIYASDHRCIECGACNRYCEMGIDIRLRARQGIALRDPECVACGACIAVCPRYALSFHPFPAGEQAVAARSSRRFSKPFRRQLAIPRKR